MNQEKIRKQFVIVKSLVIDEEGRILFVKRNMEQLKEAHNKWEFPGGKIDFGESPEEAVIRETREESGYDVEIECLLPKIISSKWESEERESQMILICYICKLIGGNANLKDHGVSEIKWFNLNESPKKSECLPGTIEFLEVYSNLQKG